MKEDKPQITYLDIPKFFPGIFIGFADNYKNFKKELKRLGVVQKCKSYTPAKVWKLTTNDQTTIILLLNKELFPENASITQIHGLIVHEVSHIVDIIYEHIGESIKGSEMTAYLHQYLFEELVYLFEEGTK